MAKPPDGLPAYNFEGLLELAGLATVTMLKRHRRQPAAGQQPVGYYWTGHDYALLYTATDAEAMPPLSPGRQRRYDQARTCAECGTRALDPFEKGDDGQRYCRSCQGPVHKRLWQQARAADRPVITDWARGVLADPAVILAAASHHQWHRHIYITDVAGAVLLDAEVRYQPDSVIDADYLPKVKERAPGTVCPTEVADTVLALAGRRLITWWSSYSLGDIIPTDEYDSDGMRIRTGLPTADGDKFGDWYDRWIGKIHGTSYRWQPSLAPQQPPHDPVEQVERMRRVLAEMAAGADRGPGVDR